MLSLCFVSFKVKDVIALYIKIQKLQNTLIQQHNCFFFFYSGGKYIFLLLRSLRKVKKILGQHFYILLTLGIKNIFIVQKKNN
jgi:hypothetical protein